MTKDLASMLTDPSLIIAALVAISVFATLYTLAGPYLVRGEFSSACVRSRPNAMPSAPANAPG